MLHQLPDLNKTLESMPQEIVVEIFGLGYVGFPLAVRLACKGINVRGIDINQERLSRLKSNKLMDSELNIKEDFNAARKNNKLDFSETPQESDMPKIGIICVPTPTPTNYTDSSVFVRGAVEKFLDTSKKGDVVILESSIEVGTTEEIHKIIESKGFTVGSDYGLTFCPERIDPQNKEWGIENIPRVIYCSDDTTFLISEQIYKHVNNANLVRVTSPRVAEVVKSFENAFRLVNISLVNELAMLCDKIGINVHEVIRAAATKPFAFLPHYPSAGAGGHCIPKDPQFLSESAKKVGLRFNTIENALSINLQMPVYISNQIEKRLEDLKLVKSVLVYGLAYKPDVEDMRDSASFKIIKELKSRKFNVYGYDPFYDEKFVEKYLKENKIAKSDLQIIKDLNPETLKQKQISCICVVQHHQRSADVLKKIYHNSLVPFIYDCQTKLPKYQDSTTVLEYLGH